MNAGDNTVLTKNLIQCRIRNGRLEPAFVNCQSETLLAQAEALIAVFKQCLGLHKAELDERLAPTLADIRPLALGKGLRKLLEDRCVFNKKKDLDYAEERRKLLSLAARLRQQQAWESPEELRQAMLQSPEAEDCALLQEKEIYADLPENDILESFDSLSTKQLLERYNLGLVQALLLNAKKLLLHIDSGEAARLRRVCKYLRFFRLLCRIKSSREGKKELITMEIDGPASIFEQPRGYGLQLAIFFPAICSLKNWQMQADILWKEKKQLLQLDQDSPLSCPYQIFSAYVPEEIKLFEKHFRKTVQDWKISEQTPFLRADDNEIIFPDFSFVNSKGKLLHLELFHRHHASRLLPRLDWLSRNPDSPLLLGVDRSLQRKPEIDAALQASDHFAKAGFIYKDYPSCEKTLQCLQKTSEKIS